MSLTPRLDKIDGTQEFPAFENLSAGDPVRLIDDNGVAKLAKVSNNPSISVEDNFDDGSGGIRDMYNQIFVPTEDAVVIFTWDGTNALHVRAGTVSGQTITWGTEVNSDIVFDGTNTSITLIDGTSNIALAYRNLTGNIACAIISISGNAVTINTGVQISAEAPGDFFIDYDTTNSRLFIAYEQVSSLKTSIGTISGTTTTWTTAVEFNAFAGLWQFYYDSIDDRIVLYYRDDNGTYDQAYVVAGQITTGAPDSITWGTAVKVNSNDNGALASLCRFDPVSGYGVFISQRGDLFVTKSTAGVISVEHFLATPWSPTLQGIVSTGESVRDLTVDTTTGIFYWIHSMGDWANTLLDRKTWIHSFSVNSDGGLTFHTSIVALVDDESSINGGAQYGVCHDSNEDQLVVIYKHTQDSTEMYSKIIDSPRIFLSDCIGIVENSYLTGETATVVNTGTVTIPSGGIAGKQAYLRSDGTIKSSSDINSVLPEEKKIGIFLSETQILLD